MPNRLYSVKNDVSNRFDDIHAMMKILDREEKINSQLLIKSSIILMFYNVVEGSFNNLLSEIFDYIAQNQIEIDSLPTRFKNTILRFYLKTINGDIKELDQFRKMDSVRLCSINYKTLKKQLNLFSGNLDALSIKNISNQLGVDMPKKLTNNDLLKIRSIRNKLAHGEVTYLSASQDITTKKLSDMCRDLEKYLSDLINVYEKFLDRIESESQTV